MADNIRIIGKVLLIIISTACLIFLVHKDETFFQLKQPKGERITKEEVLILMEALTENEDSYSEILLQNAEEEYLDYGMYLSLLEVLQITDDELIDTDKYREEFYLLKEDWYRSYELLLTYYGLQDVIRCEEMRLMSGDEHLSGKKVGEKNILTDDGRIYRYCTEKVKECNFKIVRAYIKDNMLLTVREETDSVFTLENAWIMERENESIRLFWQGYEINCPFAESDHKIKRESIADITLGKGRVCAVEEKKERISGKLMLVSANEIELEEVGSFLIDPACRVYRLYDELQEEDMDSLPIGYQFADYVIEDGRICAVLILRKENMETIRVAVKNNQFESLFHENIEVVADCDMEITYGFYEQRKTHMIKAGEKLVLTQESNYMDGDTVILKPQTLSGKIQVLSLSRNQGPASYRGNFLIGKTDKGLTLVNEVALEEYLYSVVPSEMPASYPQEALKAQAICARTYAYKYLEMPGLAAIGANVDDSVNYQVYNNIAEHANSTKAVKETAGQVLLYQNEPVSTYYYSTSCGYGTDAGVWKESNVGEYPYLHSVHINKNEDGTTAGFGNGEIMRQEEQIKEYLNGREETDYEYEEPWYRWSYKVEELEPAVIYERVYNRFCADETKVLKRTEMEETEAEAVYERILPEEFSEIYEMVCNKRRDGGVMDELLLYTDSGVYKIISEYNIRYILSHGKEVIRQDGSMVPCGQLLPSAYMVIEAVKENGVVTGFVITGGGYGHGVGMSQNGAKNMAEEELSFEEILDFFYPKCSLQKIY